MSDTGYLSVTADGVTRYVELRKQEVAPAPLRGDSTLRLTPDIRAAAALTLPPSRADTVALDFVAAGRRRVPVSACPAYLGSRGVESVWFSAGSAVGAWPIDKRPMSAGRQQRQHDIRCWDRVAVEGGFRLRMTLCPERYLCAHGDWLCLGDEKGAAVFAFVVVVA
jgi:hypothetical protein